LVAYVHLACFAQIASGDGAAKEQRFCSVGHRPADLGGYGDAIAVAWASFSQQPQERPRAAADALSFVVQAILFSKLALGQGGTVEETVAGPTLNHAQCRDAMLA